MGFGTAILPCTYVEISANYTALVSAILPYSYGEIRDNHTSFVLAGLSYSYLEIRDNHTGLGSTILHGQCVDISAQTSMIIPDFYTCTRKNG
jgi:hypothetical protein